METEFYRDDDPIIVLARACQRDETIAQSRLQDALDSEHNESGYASCLVTGVGLLREASVFRRGERLEPPDVRQGRKKKTP